MRITGGKVRLSASDLANHLGCRHLSSLDLDAAHGRLTPSTWRDPMLEVLQERGFQHEAEYLERLREQGLGIVEVSGEGVGSAFDATVSAMRGGADVIVQATLADGDWFGRADILRWVPTESGLGGWSYEVIDTKLARETRAGKYLHLEGRHAAHPGTGRGPRPVKLSSD